MINQVGQFLLSSGFVDTDEEAEENCQALAKSLQKVRPERGRGFRAFDGGVKGEGRGAREGEIWQEGGKKDRQCTVAW